MAPGSKPSDLVEAEFTKEVLMTYDKHSKDAKSCKKNLRRLWKKGVQVCALTLYLMIKFENSPN